MTSSGSLRITVANPLTQLYAQQGYAGPVWPFSGACTVYLTSKARQDYFCHFTLVLAISKQGLPVEARRFPQKVQKQSLLAGL